MLTGLRPWELDQLEARQFLQLCAEIDDARRRRKENADRGR